MKRYYLTMLQSLPLEIKVAKSMQRIREAIYEFGVDHIYVPVSGGIDSAVLSDIVYKVQDEMGIPREAIPRVNSNTGNEYPEVLRLARKLSDVEVKPLMSFYEVITRYGYPVASKKTSRMLSDFQNPTPKNEQSRYLYTTGLRKDGKKATIKLAERWKVFLDSDVRVTHKCCQFLKKEPLMRYEKENDRHPILGTMADEKGGRENGYLKTGCNAFKMNKSLPLGFWTKDDILSYVVLNDIEIAEVYGDIVEVGTKKKVSKLKVRLMVKYGRKIHLETTKEKRTGCVACTYGVQFEKGDNRFIRLKEYNRKFYDFVIRGGYLDEEGYWRPKGGLGLGHVLDLMGIDYGGYEQMDIEDFM